MTKPYAIVVSLSVVDIRMQQTVASSHCVSVDFVDERIKCGDLC
jgi:hypothetical protein